MGTLYYGGDLDILRRFLKDERGNLVYLAPSLVELLRLLKPTGSLYLHCDSTASHFRKLACDGVSMKRISMPNQQASN
jgi:site-specific DNA-methyltransferase (adenine-specific)